MVGNYYADRGNRAEAIHYYLQAISLDRHFTQAYHNIGNLHLDLALEKEDPTREQDLQNAERAYRKAIRLERCDASSYDGIAILEMERKKYEVARDAAKQALSCDSNDGAYLATLGQIQLRSGDRDAERIIKDAFAIAPEDPQVNFALGELYEWLKDYSTAAKHFKVALEGGAFADVYRRSYARALHRAGNHKEAVEIYKGIKKMFLEDRRAIESLEGGATLLGQ